jgi:GT2 family glycosyltransferase
MSAEVSVVIPSRRGARLRRALDSLCRQSLAPKRFEVVVVRDPSADWSDLPEAAPLDVTLVRDRRGGGPGALRNVGWPAGSAPLVAFTDDDCEPAPGWLEALMRVHSRSPGAVLQGRTAPNPNELDALGPYARTISVDALGPWFPTCNMAYPRDVLEEVGGFDESYATVAEDTDLAWRARERGHRIEFVADAVVHHAVNRLGPRGKLALAAGWTAGVRVFRDHPALRSHLFLGVFWKRSHALLLLAALGALLTRRSPAAALLALPYTRDLRARMAAERAAPTQAPYYVVQDGVELAAVARGAAGARVIVL